MKRYLASIALLAGLCLTPAASADDSSAVLGIGGLHFTHTDAIQMVSEDLYLSMTQVRIRYSFRNLTNRDVTTLVAFPLPDITPNYYFEPVNIPAPGEANFVRFRTRVDGRDIPMEVDQRAFLGSRDVTDRVRASGLPFSPIDPRFDQAAAHMNASVRAALLHDGLLEDLNPGDKNNPSEYRPLWALRTAFHRMQTFPAGRTINVEQSYTPISGGSVESMLLVGDRNNAERRRLVRDYCVDSAFETASRALARRVGGPEHVQEGSLAYILTTGANWAGPIGRLHITIDKGDRQNLMSLCAPGIRRTSPTQFELNYTNYTPRSDIRVLFLIPTPPEQ